MNMMRTKKNQHERGRSVSDIYRTYINKILF